VGPPDSIGAPTATAEARGLEEARQVAERMLSSPRSIRATLATGRARADERCRGSGSVFFAGLWSRLSARHSAEVCGQVRQALDASGDGLRQARAGELDAAQRSFARARAVMSSPPLPVEAQRVARSLVNAARAYLEYRRSRNARAEQRVQAAWRDDLWLERERGYDILHLHRVQLLANSVRLRAHAGRVREAVDLAARSIRYLSEKERAPEELGSFLPEALKVVGPELLLGLQLHILEEVALALSPRELDPAPALAAFRSALGSNRLNSVAVDWSRAKACRFAGDPAGFLAAALPLLADGPRYAPRIRLDLLLDLECVPGHVSAASDEVLRHAHEELRGLGVPDVMQHRLEAMRARAD
jgi:hypothetical protein